MANFNRYGERQPRAVKVPGGTGYLVREIEHDATRCAFCKLSPRVLFSYDDESLPFCNRSCWISHLVQQLTSPARKSKATRLANQQAVVKAARSPQPPRLQLVS